MPSPVKETDGRAVPVTVTEDQTGTAYKGQALIFSACELPEMTTVIRRFVEMARDRGGMTAELLLAVVEPPTTMMPFFYKPEATARQTQAVYPEFSKKATAEEFGVDQRTINNWMNRHKFNLASKPGEQVKIYRDERYMQLLSDRKREARLRGKRKLSRDSKKH